MSASNFSLDYRNPIVPRADDDDDDRDEAAVGRLPAQVGALIQRKFLEERKIFLWGAVTDESAKDLTEKLLYLEAAAPGKGITFYINTPGGSITAGMAVFDTIRLISSPVTVVVTGSGYADEPPSDSDPYTFDPDTLKVDMKEQRREMRLRFRSNTQNGDFFMGRVLLSLDTGDVRGTGNP